MLKKGGKKLHIVHNLELLNAVTIQHSGVPPFTKLLTEHFASHACGSILDLYVSYNEHMLAKQSHNYTTFQTLFGTFWLVTLPMG